MQLEQLRIRNGSDYVFNVESGLDTESVYVPPLILQPLSKIRYGTGFNTKPEKSNSNSYSKTKDRLHIVVEDNGVESAEKNFGNR